MHSLKFAAVFSFISFLIICSDTARADLVCDRSNIPEGHVVISLVANQSCPNFSPIGRNTLMTSPVYSGISMCSAYGYPIDYVITSVSKSPSCAPASGTVGDTVFGDGQTIKKPDPGGDYMCRKSAIPRNFARGSLIYAAGCEEPSIYPDGKNAYNIYDPVYINQRPPVPANLNSSYANNTLMFSWNDPAVNYNDVRNYEIQVFRDGQLIHNLVKDKAEDTNYILINPKYGKYTFNIRSVKYVQYTGRYLYSDYISKETIAGVYVPAPYDFNVSTFPNGAKLTWKMPENITQDDINHFEIKKYINGKQNFTYTADCNARELNMHDIPSGNYMFQIRAVKIIGDKSFYSAYSTLEISLQPPQPPSDFTGTASGDNITVSWTYESEAQGFVLKYRKTSERTWMYINLPPDARNYTIEKGFRGTYEFTLQAIKNERKSDPVYTSVSLNKPYSPLTDYLPYNLNAEIVNNSDIALTWNLPEQRGDNISIIWYTNPNTTNLKEIIISPNETNYTFINIFEAEGQKLYFEVRVIKNGFYSDIISKIVYIPINKIILDFSEVSFDNTVSYSIPESFTKAVLSECISASGSYTFYLDDNEIYNGKEAEEGTEFTFNVLPGQQITGTFDAMGYSPCFVTLFKAPSAGQLDYFNATHDGEGNIDISWAQPSFSIDNYVMFVSKDDIHIKYEYLPNQTSAKLNNVANGTYEIIFAALSNYAYSEEIYSEVTVQRDLKPILGEEVILEGYESRIWTVPDGYNKVIIRLVGGSNVFSVYINDKYASYDSDFNVYPGDTVYIESYDMMETLIKIEFFNSYNFE